jgi:enterochelin esterase family protein
MSHLEGTSLWYVTREFEPDDLLDYMLAIDDPMTPLSGEKNLVERVTKHWHVDPLNDRQIKTAQINVSVLQMPQARPFPDWSTMPGVPRGTVTEHTIDSRQLGFEGRGVWVYTPPGYTTSGEEYPLLMLMDALWCTGPLQVPYIADALIKHHRMQPTVIAMLQSAPQDQRPRELVTNDRHALFLLSELLPFLQNQYHINPLDIGVGGVGMGAIASMHATLTNPAAFSHLLMISPPLQGQEVSLQDYRRRFETAAMMPDRIFQAVGRYETFSRFLKPGRRLAEVIERRSDVAYRFIEHGSGHGLVGFKGILPEALAWTYPDRKD